MFILNGIKWGSSTLGTPSGEITWNDDLGGLDAAAGASTFDLVSSLSSAFTAWENVAALDFREVSFGVDIDIGYGSFSTDGDTRNDGAVATASWNGGNFYSEPTNVRIEFNSDETWSPFADSDPSTVNFFAVALHEIGHVIGHHHIDDPTQIMNPVISVDSLGDFDIAGAQELYGLDGGDVPVDVDPPDSGLESGDGGGGGAGILLGLLALVFGLFTGGFGAAAVMAAGRVADEGDEGHDESEDRFHSEDHDHLFDGEHYHASFFPTVPFEKFAQIQVADDGEDDDFFLL